MFHAIFDTGRSDMTSLPVEKHSDESLDSVASWNSFNLAFQLHEFANTDPYTHPTLKDPLCIDPTIDWSALSSSSKTKKLVCVNCRQRKKGCDLKLPSCSLCSKHGDYCVYPNNNINRNTRSDSISQFQADLADSQPKPGLLSPSSDSSWSHVSNWATPSESSSQQGRTDALEAGPNFQDCSQAVATRRCFDQRAQIDCETGNLASKSSTSDLAMSFYPSSASGSLRSISSRLETVPDLLQNTTRSTTADLSLPLPKELSELVGAFFHDHHHILPCIHRERFLAWIDEGSNTTTESPLLWSILAVSATFQKNPNLRHRGQKWLAKAVDLLDSDLNRCSKSTQIFQASVWVTFLVYSSGKYHQAWLLLSRSYHLASLAGIDRVDRFGPRASNTVSNDSFLCEEQRKIMWSFYILDRSISTLLSVPLILDDNYICVNFPLEDDEFQACSMANFENTEHFHHSFTCDLTVLMGPCILQSLASVPTISDIYRVAILLGRIVTYYNQPQSIGQSKKTSDDLTSLENILSLFEFALSRSPLSLQALHPAAATTTLWLHTLVQTCSILLFHPQVTSSISSAENTTRSLLKTSALEKCGASVQRMLQKFRATEHCPFVLKNPFLLNACYLGSHLLVIISRSKCSSRQSEIQFLLDVMESISTHGYTLAQKFIYEIRQDAERDEDEVRKIRTGRGYYLE